ncbi:hypothetical protein DTO027I6_9623 [Penicillium roqueforti]|nr:hypothetical protein CBS147337_9803 [Penicillium roqueforti]KAI3185983.1 hypothetical protein DTO027I6_9623 [Penicillium roqueforti]
MDPILTQATVTSFDFSLSHKPSSKQTCQMRFITSANVRLAQDAFHRTRIYGLILNDTEERLLLSEIAKCRAHSGDLIDKCDTQCEQTHGNGDENGDGYENEDDNCEALCAPNTDERPRTFYCPYKGCKRKEPFDKKKKLRRHFAIRNLAISPGYAYC